jgi:hypothetical protein
MARVKYVINGVHMACQHAGLAALLKKETKIDIKTLSPDDIVICINSRGDKLKMFAGSGLVVGYLKMPGGQKIFKEAVQYIPQAFGSSGLDFDKACKLALEKRLEGREGPLNPLDVYKIKKERLENLKP